MNGGRSGGGGEIGGRWLAGNRRGRRRLALEWLVQAQAPANLDITQNSIAAEDAHQPPGVIHYWQLVHVAAGHQREGVVEVLLWAHRMQPL